MRIKKITFNIILFSFFINSYSWADFDGKEAHKMTHKTGEKESPQDQASHKKTSYSSLVRGDLSKEERRKVIQEHLKTFTPFERSQILLDSAFDSFGCPSFHQWPFFDCSFFPRFPSFTLPLRWLDGFDEPMFFDPLFPKISFPGMGVKGSSEQSKGGQNQEKNKPFQISGVCQSEEEGAFSRSQTTMSSRKEVLSAKAFHEVMSGSALETEKEATIDRALGNMCANISDQDWHISKMEDRMSKWTTSKDASFKICCKNTERSRDLIPYFEKNFSLLQKKNKVEKILLSKEDVKNTDKLLKKLGDCSKSVLLIDFSEPTDNPFQLLDEVAKKMAQQKPHEKAPLLAIEIDKAKANDCRGKRVGCTYERSACSFVVEK